MTCFGATVVVFLAILLFVVTIKNEKPVEMVLNSTCKSSCLLVTKNSINLVFYLLQSEIVLCPAQHAS